MSLFIINDAIVLPIAYQDNSYVISLVRRNATHKAFRRQNEHCHRSYRSEQGENQTCKFMNGKQMMD